MIQTNPEHEDLTKLGEGATQPKRELETFPNRNPERAYVVELRTNEFTCLPQNGPTGLRRDFHPLRSRPKDRRIEIPHALFMDLSGRGSLPRTLRQPAAQRLGRRACPQMVSGRGRFQRPGPTSQSSVPETPPVMASGSPGN